jgi:Uma2 family endonuclease
MPVQHNIREIVDGLPEEAVLTLDGVEWEEYEQVLQDLDGRRGVRISYDCGRLDIVTTSPGHERRKDFLLGLVHEVSVGLDIPMESFGQATWQLKRLRKGAEADTCFYVAGASMVVGREHITLGVDPPPDVVVEIDVSSQSDRKFPIYAAFQVPEVWQFKAGGVKFFALQGQKYAETPASISFPILTSAVVTRYLRRSEVEGLLTSLKAFRRWVRRQKQAS